MSRKGTRAKQAPDEDVRWCSGAAAILTEVHGENQGERHPGEFGRLHLEAADVDPALRAAGAVARDQDENQKRDQRAEEKQRMLGELAVVEHEAHDQGDAANAERVHLGHELTTRTSGPVRKTDVGRAVDHRQANAGDDEHGSEEEPVDVEIKSAFEHNSVVSR